MRRAGLVEGRKPNYHVSAAVAAVTGKKADYIRTRAFDNDHYHKMIRDYIVKYGQASREEIDKLILDKLSDALSEDQKKKKVGNLLSALRAKGVIYNAGSKTAPQWKLEEQT